VRFAFSARRPRRLRPIRLPARESLRRGVFILPSLFTVGNMLCGFAAVQAAFHARLVAAGWLIVLAGILDALDGRIARLTHATSEFGKEYDSLADVVSFGLAPAILVFQWRLEDLGRSGFAVAFLFLVAGSVRLARFNVQAGAVDKRFFVGLPIPAGAGALTLAVLLDPTPVASRGELVIVGLYVLAVSLLMVSTIQYRSFKDFNLHQRFPATLFFLLALIVVILVTYRQYAMAVLLGAYLLLGPVEAVLRAVLHKPIAPSPGFPAEAAPPVKTNDADLS
jgi:CDP-diacylglycerol--serine O-phosphatidyltransferase